MNRPLVEVRVEAILPVRKRKLRNLGQVEDKEASDMALIREMGDRAMYEIKVEGLLDESWFESFESLAMVAEARAGGESLTRLTCATDQAGRRGILDGLWNRHMVLLSVSRLEPSETEA